jgi:hypothetical protein
MSSHDTCPYRTVPDFQRWDRAFAAERLEQFDPYEGQTARFGFGKPDKIVTAGSCFAQNIAKRLNRYDYNYVMSEYDPAVTPEENEDRKNTMFSARYGNIYTVAHLVQLIAQAFGHWTPQEEFWKVGERYFDPYRPSMDPEGFASLEALRRARAAHLGAVRSAFQNCDVFIFTLGLTEGWVNTLDGAAYPIAPGCGYGTFDPQKYAFKNYTLAEINEGLDQAIASLRSVNPGVKIILTVSPVPLASTMEPRHVLLSTAYSKSVLRLACEEAVRKFDAVDYFASFEIANWGREMSSYFTGNLRTVSETGIDHVMRVFFRHYAGHVLEAGTPRAETGETPARESLNAKMSEKIWCDEDYLFDEGVSGAFKGQQRARYVDPDTQNAEVRAQGGAKYFEATAQRHPHPYTGWKGAPGSKVLFGRTLDRNGYYNSRDIADYMGPQHKRVCVIGPSIVMDLQNDEPETICGVMQREFNMRGFEHVFVYNCGIHASVTGQDVSNLLHYVTKFDPDIVVALSGGNDLGNAWKGDPRPGFPQSFFLWEKILQSFRSKQTTEGLVAYLEDFTFDLMTLRQMEAYRSKKWFLRTYQKYEDYVYTMRSISRGFDFGLHIVNPPTAQSHRYRKVQITSPLVEDPGFHFDAMCRSEFFRNKLAALREEDAFLSSDRSELVDDLESKAVFEDRSHMRPFGYERLAKTIVDDLITGFPGRTGAPQWRAGCQVFTLNGKRA